MQLTEIARYPQQPAPCPAFTLRGRPAPADTQHRGVVPEDFSYAGESGIYHISDMCEFEVVPSTLLQGSDVWASRAVGWGWHSPQSTDSSDPVCGLVVRRELQTRLCSQVH